MAKVPQHFMTRSGMHLVRMVSRLQIALNQKRREDRAAGRLQSVAFPDTVLVERPRQ